MKTAVVILNWNTREYLERFLPPLIKSCEGQDAQVVVADNASTDGSAEFVKSAFPDVRCIILEKNFGFTGGYNRVLSEIEAEYFILINSDIEVPRDWLSPLIDWMDCHSECGACGPALHSYQQRDSFEYAGAAGGYIDRFGYPFCRGRVLKRLEKDEGQYSEPKDVLWVSGACLCTRSSLWKQLGGLDDRFFAHMEEIDYCWRLQLAGYNVTVVPQSKVYHLGGGTLPQDSPWKLQLNYRNNLLLLDNNLAASIGGCKAAFRIAFRKCLDLGSAAVYLLTGRKEYAAAVLEAHRQYRKLRIRGKRRKGSKVSGLHGICILPMAFLKGEHIFKYLREYENRH